MLPMESLEVASLTQPRCSLPAEVVSPLLLRFMLEGFKVYSTIE